MTRSGAFAEDETVGPCRMGGTRQPESAGTRRFASGQPAISTASILVSTPPQIAISGFAEHDLLPGVGDGARTRRAEIAGHRPSPAAPNDRRRRAAGRELLAPPAAAPPANLVPHVVVRERQSLRWSPSRCRWTPSDGGVDLRDPALLRPGGRPRSPSSADMTSGGVRPCSIPLSRSSREMTADAYRQVTPR